eukprot:GEMP01067972.1.p1 GENE.GEMP01067972.1~~GEMP01067972.1.p1  ORF type:complete len:188 (+),score=31.15 GEMP01067972.1:188-751(+)
MHLEVLLTLACHCAIGEELATSFKGLSIQKNALDASPPTQFDDDEDDDEDDDDDDDHHHPDSSLLLVKTGDHANKFLQSEPKMQQVMVPEESSHTQASLKQESREAVDAVKSNEALVETDGAKPIVMLDDDDDSMENKIDTTYHMGTTKKEFLSKEDRRNRQILLIVGCVSVTFGGLLLFIWLATRG